MRTSTATAVISMTTITAAITAPAITPPDTPDGGGSTEGIGLGEAACRKNTIHCTNSYSCLSTFSAYSNSCCTS